MVWDGSRLSDDHSDESAGDHADDHAGDREDDESEDQGAGRGGDTAADPAADRVGHGEDEYTGLEPRGGSADDLDFDRFYAAAFRRVVGQVFAVTGNLPEAEDAVQEAFARAWTRWRKVREYGEPEAWVRTVAFRIAVSSWRKAVNRVAAHRREAPADAVPDLGPDHVALVSALRRIPLDQRHAVVLFHVAGLSIEEIAAQTGVRTGTVKSRLARGRRALVPYLSDPAEPVAEPSAEPTAEQPRKEDSLHA